MLGHKHLAMATELSTWLATQCQMYCTQFVCLKNVIYSWQLQEYDASVPQVGVRACLRATKSATAEECACQSHTAGNSGEMARHTVGNSGEMARHTVGNCVGMCEPHSWQQQGDVRSTQLATAGGCLLHTVGNNRVTCVRATKSATAGGCASHTAGNSGGNVNATQLAIAGVVSTTHLATQRKLIPTGSTLFL